MKQVSFKATKGAKKQKEVIDTITYRDISYEDALRKAIVWFAYKNDSTLNFENTAKFKNRMVTTESINLLYNDLNIELPNYFELRRGINALPLPNDNVKLIIVGSAIPQGIRFFYTGENNKIYKWIDEIKNTDLMQYLKNNDLDSLEREVRHLGIIFIDIADIIVNKIGSYSDDDIICYSINIETYDQVRWLIENKNAYVVAANQNASIVLQKVFGIENQFASLMSFAKKGPWLEIIKTHLLKTTGKD